ncbi:MAG: THUMP domain-containing protein [Candidatus Njordarchaeales archaeon]
MKNGATPIIPSNTKLLVTSNRYYELDAASEVWHILKATNIADDAEVTFIRKGKWWLRGVIAFSFELNGITILDAMERIRAYLLRRPWIMEFSQRIIPVELVSTDFSEIKSFVTSVANKRIRSNEKWAIKISKRDSKIKRQKIIEEIASQINVGKVDLENPDWIINIEVIRNTYAGSVIRSHHLIRKKEIVRADC